MFNKVTLIGRLGQNAETKTAQNSREYVILSIATQESWKNKDGEYLPNDLGAAKRKPIAGNPPACVGVDKSWTPPSVSNTLSKRHRTITPPR